MVLALLRLAVKQGIQFSVVVTEGRVSKDASTVPCLMHSYSHVVVSGAGLQHCVDRMVVRMLAGC